MNKYRRAVLNKFCVGSLWVSPVIQSVSLPAHAETSNGLIYSQFVGAGNFHAVSVVAYHNHAVVLVRYFFDGGCGICGSEVEYKAIPELTGSPIDLVAIDYGCGTTAPEVLGQISIQDYRYGDSTITMKLQSTEVDNLNTTIPIGGDADLGPFLCT